MNYKSSSLSNIKLQIIYKVKMTIRATNLKFYNNNKHNFRFLKKIKK